MSGPSLHAILSSGSFFDEDMFLFEPEGEPQTDARPALELVSAPLVAAVETAPEPDTQLPLQSQLGPVQESVQEDVQPRILQWTIVGQTTAKPRNDYFERGHQVVWRQNEDRFRFAETGTGMRAAVADGAGSSGMYCGAWAETLVNRLPAEPLADHGAVNRWIEGFWQDFSREYKQQASIDPAKSTKFVKEGSFATLVACWLERQDDGFALSWCGYGDSPLLIFDRSGGDAILCHAHPGTLGALAQAPHLLNWKDLAEETHFQGGSVDIKGPATVVLASDGVGQFMLLRYLADRQALPPKEGPSARMVEEFVRLNQSGNSKLADLARNHSASSGEGFGQELKALKASLQSEAVFLDLIKTHHEAGLLPNDDATLVMIDID